MDSRKRWTIFGVILAAAAVGAGAWWLHARNFEETDDAFIDASIVAVNSKVRGQVLAIHVEDNQPVKAGDPLLEIDATDYKVRAAQAKAELTAAETEAGRAHDDAVRAVGLFKRDQISRQAYEKAQADAAVLAAKAEVARARLEAAELDLTYTRIAAPQAGRVTKRSVEVRSWVEVGQPLMALVPEEVYVTANYKETQLALMRPGQPATIHVDAYGREFKGHVDSIQAGTGSRFSLLPPENASGNFVKVVQRVPVKIVFDEPTAGLMLAPGMSAVPSVRVR